MTALGRPSDFSVRKVSMQLINRAIRYCPLRNRH